MGKDDELIINFMYPKLLDHNTSTDEWFKIADQEYGLLKTKPHLLSCLMAIRNEEGGWNELRYDVSHDWLITVVVAIQKYLVDLGIPNFEGTLGFKYWNDKMREKFWDIDHLYKVVGDCLSWLNQKYGNREI